MKNFVWKYLDVIVLLMCLICFFHDKFIWRGLYTLIAVSVCSGISTKYWLWHSKQNSKPQFPKLKQ